MKKIALFIVLTLMFFNIPTTLYASTASDIQAQIGQLQQQKAQLLSQRQSIVSQLSALGVEVLNDVDQEKKKDEDEVYTGKKPDINDIDLSKPEGPRVTPELTDLQSRIEIGPDGKPRVPLEDVIRFQGNTQMMRDLKNASPEVREAFNRTLRESVYGPHDQKLREYIRSLPGNENLSLDDIKIDDFRTPREGQTPDDMMKDINTDRDYRVLVKNDKGEWIEVDTRKWKDRSQMILSETSGFQKPKSWDEMTPEERTAARDKHQETFQKPDGWDNMTPEEQFNAVKKHQDGFERPRGWDQMTGAERMRAIEEHNAKLSQMATDKGHREAGRDYSDQDIDPQTGKRRQLDEPNILKVKRGETTLIDAEGLGMQYREKVEAALRDGNKPEAVAQLQKAVDSLGHIREGYAKQGYDVGKLPKNLQAAMEAVAQAKTDTRANPAELEATLKDLGFEGGIDEVSRKVSSQVGALKIARKTTGARVRAAVTQGAEDFKKGAEAHDEAKKVAEVAVKLADGAYTAHTWSKEADARATANQQITRRNQKVDDFYSRYDSDAEFRRTIDEKAKAGQMRLPSREHVKPMEEAGIGEKLGLESVSKDGTRIAVNVLDDIDSVNSVLKLTEYAAQGEGVVGQMARSDALKNVKGSLGTTAQVAGNIATVVNTGRNLHQVSVESAKTQDALDEESRNVTTANVTIDRYRQTQQRVQSEVADKHGGDWRAYVAANRKDFGSMTQEQQDKLVRKIQTSATKKVEDAKYVGWTTDDIDVLGSVDAGLTNAPVVGGVYTSGKNIVKLGSETVQLGQAYYNEHEAEGRAQYTDQRVGNAGNVAQHRLVQARDNYQQRINDIKSGKSKEKGLTVAQLEERMGDLERRIEEEGLE